jgi:hypothetical protein
MIGGFGWLALPVWPLVLARRVFNKPPIAHLQRGRNLTAPAGQAVAILIDAQTVTVIHHDTGEVLSEHSIDPQLLAQPTQQLRRSPKTI